MTRPTRIQYENAFYHVMNRGRGGQTIFHDSTYYQSYLKILEEATERFDAVIHAYCLMKNHYHVLIETPRANLDRIMRHINGVYTQRYNRLKQTDGPLFRGRYKAILVDADSYLLQLSRYIHRNPVEIKGGMEENLDHYVWSSYRAYINQVKSPKWLHRHTLYGMLGLKQKYAGYQQFVSKGIDEDIKRFYSKGNLANVLGDKGFRQSLLEKEDEIMSKEALEPLLRMRPTAETILTAVSKVCKVTIQELTERKRGRQQANFPRKLAIYCCQQLGDLPLKKLATIFNMQHEGSLSPAINEIKNTMEEKAVRSKLVKIQKHLDII